MSHLLTVDLFILVASFWAALETYPGN